MMPKTGVHSVVVPPQTRTSPGCTVWRSATVVITRATPSTTPLAAGKPADLGDARPGPRRPCPSASRNCPDSPNTSIMIGSGTVSGIVPSMVGSYGPRSRQCSK